MTLTDLFDWTRGGIFGDIQNGKAAQAGVVLRNVQVNFAKRLAKLWTSPAAGTPPDAQALARLQLEYLVNDSATALRAVEARRTDARASRSAPGVVETGFGRARDDRATRAGCRTVTCYGSSSIRQVTWRISG